LGVFDMVSHHMHTHLVKTQM